MRIRASLLFTVVCAGAAGSLGAQDDAIARVESTQAVELTVSRLESAIRSRGLTLFATVDHAANAKAAGLTLRPTVLLIVGNPQVGTRLMQCTQEAAIDLPLKFLVWQDAADVVWVGYTRPTWLASRHGLQGCEGVLERVESGLASIAREAAT